MNNDLIRRGELKEELHNWAICLNRPSCYSKDDADYIIDYVPAVDAVEVVRCRDCKYWLHETVATIDHYECGVFCDSYGRGYLTGADDFCSCGVRRKDK